MRASRDVARRVVSLALALCFLLVRCQAGGETKSLGLPVGEASDMGKEWKYFVNVLELLLFQPGRAMGTPWPEKAPFEFVRLFGGQLNFCASCVNLMDNWEASEPHMILFRAPKYVSKFPELFYVACGSVEAKFLRSEDSGEKSKEREEFPCVQAFKKFSLQKYYEGFSSAPTLRRRAAFPATHTDHRPFKPLYDPLYKTSPKTIHVRKSTFVDHSKHSYIPLIPPRSTHGDEQRASYPMSHASVAVESRHNYVPILSRVPGPDGPHSVGVGKGVFPKNTTHTYIPIFNVPKHEEMAAFPASRTNMPVDPNHGFIPLTKKQTYGYDTAPSLPASRTNKPSDTSHGYIPLYTTSNYSESASFPASRTHYPTDPDHGFIPLFQKVHYYNSTAAASLPASRTSQPSDTNHKFIPIFEHGESNATSSLPTSRVKAIIDTRHGYIPIFQRTGADNETASFPASRTRYPADPNHGFIPLYMVAGNSTETMMASFPASRTRYPTDPSHGFVPLFMASNCSESASFPASRTRYPADPNHGFIPLYMVAGNSTETMMVSFPASRTRYPTDPNHGFIPLYMVAGNSTETMMASFPASRTRYPTDPSHGFVPLFTKLYLYNDTSALPASRTSKPTDPNHGYIPIFGHSESNATSSLPASRVPVPLNSTHSYIPLITKPTREEHAAKPASSTGVPAPGAPAGNLPYTILVSIPRAALPASRTDMQSGDHDFVPLFEKREETGPRAAFPATHTSVEAPGLDQQRPGIEWEHYTEVLKVDSEGNPYVDTKCGRIYGFGDLSAILSKLDQEEAMEKHPQRIIEDR